MPFGKKVLVTDAGRDLDRPKAIAAADGEVDAYGRNKENIESLVEECENIRPGARVLAILNIFFAHSMAANSAVLYQVCHRCILVALVTFNNDKDPIKNDRARHSVDNCFLH